MNSRTFLACMACLLFWESITSMPKEIELIWRQRKWGLVKGAYLLNKYCAIIGMILYLAFSFSDISFETCRKIHWLPYLFCLISMAHGDMILGVRLYALYSKKLWIAVLFGVMLNVLGASSVWAAHENGPLILTPGQKGCISVPSDAMEKYAVVPWVICVVYDATAVALTVFKIWRYKKVGGASSLLFDLILQDGLIYFALVFSTKLAVTLNFAFNKDNPSLMVPVAASIGSLMCTRLLFNMHAAGQSVSQIATHSSRGFSWRTGPKAGGGGGQNSNSNSLSTPVSPYSTHFIRSPVSPFSPGTPAMPHHLLPKRGKSISTSSRTVVSDDRDFDDEEKKVEHFELDEVVTAAGRRRDRENGPDAGRRSGEA